MNLGKIQNAGLSPSAFYGENIQSAALNHFVYVPMSFEFFPEIALGDGPKKWHIFLFSTAYFPSYWHMPFEISITINPNWLSICTYYFHLLSPNCVLTSDDSGFFQKTRSVMAHKNSRIRVKCTIIWTILYFSWKCFMKQKLCLDRVFQNFKWARKNQFKSFTYIFWWLRASRRFENLLQILTSKY